MQIVIKIHEKDYQAMKNGHIPFSVYDVIMNGTPLPEHGDLKDVNDIWNNIPDVNALTNHFTTYDIQHFIDNAPTIIEAEKE